MTLTKRVSVPRACRLTGLARSSYYYEPKPRPPAPIDPVVRDAVVEVCTERPSFGYRRTTAMTRRRIGRAINEKRVRRIMRLEGLTLHPCVQPPRRRVPKHAGRQITTRPDEAWQLDLKYVGCGRDGWAYLQSVVDCCTSEWLGYVFDKRCGSREAVGLLQDVVAMRFPSAGTAPGTRLRVDNGPAYRADRFIDHAAALGFDLEHIQIKTPEDNGVIESFHAALDRDYLDLTTFDTFEEANAYIAHAFNDYNTTKPKKRLGWLTPTEYYQAQKVMNSAQ